MIFLYVLYYCLQHRKVIAIWSYMEFRKSFVLGEFYLYDYHRAFRKIDNYKSVRFCQKALLFYTFI